MSSLFLLLIGVILVAFGALMIVTGQSISCFVAIEKNTRATQELLKTQLAVSQSVEGKSQEGNDQDDGNISTDNLFE